MFSQGKCKYKNRLNKIFLLLVLYNTMPTQRGGLPVGILGGSFLAPLGGGRRRSRSSRSRSSRHSHKFRTMKRKSSGRKTRKSAEPWWKVW
jgi:hypothetical protein